MMAGPFKDGAILIASYNDLDRQVHVIEEDVDPTRRTLNVLSTWIVTHLGYMMLVYDNVNIFL